MGRPVLVAALVLAACLIPAVPAAADSSTVPVSDWMGTLPGIADIPLTELPLPGTHDSATSTLSGDSPWSQAGRNDIGDIVDVIPRSVAASWSKAQPAGVGQQLRDGIRYLDLRLTREPDGFVYLEHGLRGPRVEQVLAEIGEFTRTHPREVVLVGLNRYTAFDDLGHAQVRSAVVKEFGDRIAPAATGLTLRRLWEAGRNVVLFDNSGKLLDLGAFGAGAIDAPWPNTMDPAVVIATIQRTMLNHDHNRFSALGTTVTPDFGGIVNGTLNGVTSLADLSVRTIHPPAAHWLRGVAPGRNVNIVTTDWYTNPMCGTSFVRLVLARADGRDAGQAPCDAWGTGSGTYWSWGDWSVHTWADFAWTPVPGATRYEIQLDGFAGGGCVVDTTAQSDAPSVRVDRQNVAWAEYICLGSQYDVRVRALVGGQWKPWSTARRIRL